jgi:SCY1-like protein 1
VDAYAFGILVYEVFNGGFLGTDQLTQPKLVPVSMQSGYKRLISANPKVRLSTAQFLEQGLRSGGFFETPLIHLTDGIENLGLKSEEEREELLRLVHARQILCPPFDRCVVCWRAYPRIFLKTFLN